MDHQMRLVQGPAGSMKRHEKQLKIGVKYCGGCNPNYDRVALVRRVEERLNGKVALVKAEGNGSSLILAVVGCSTACADLRPFAGQEIRVITCLADAELFIRDIETRVS